MTVGHNSLKTYLPFTFLSVSIMERSRNAFEYGVVEIGEKVLARVQSADHPINFHVEMLPLDDLCSNLI